MLPQPKPEVERYPENKLNLFSQYQDEESLREAYRQFVKENGTSEYINYQFRKRMCELDFIYNSATCRSESSISPTRNR